MRPIAFREDRAVKPLDFLAVALRSASFARFKVRKGLRERRRV
jgi:hypothetical protein